MANLGRSNIELTANTSRARRSLGDFFRQAENAGRQFTRVLNALDPFANIERDSRAASGSMDNLQDAARRLDSDLNDLGGSNRLDELNQDVDRVGSELSNLGDAANSTDQQLGGLGDETSLDGLLNDASTASDTLSSLSDTSNTVDGQISQLGGDTELDSMNSEATNAGNILDRLADDLNIVESAVDDAGNEFGEFGNAAERESGNANDSFSRLGDTAKKLGGLLVAAFAVDKVKDFFLTVVETTADLDAVNSQYEQVMGGMKDSTDKYLNEMSTTWNKHPNELKSAYMQYVALLKGKGVAEEEAHATAQKYMDLTVDGNAFANESMEDTVGRFAAMIKGEYSSVDTAMVNLTATQLDALAKSTLGKKFAELTTAEQELLKTNEALRQQDIAGVIGQGAREADSYQNNVAMLKSTWDDFIATYGGPAMEFANNRLKQAIGFVRGLGEHIETAKNKLKPFSDAIRAVFSLIKDDKGTAISILSRLGLSADQIQAVLIAVTMIQDYLSRIRDSAVPIFDKISNTIKSAFVDLWPLVVSAVTTYLGYIVNFWSKNGASIMDSLQKIGSVIKEVLVEYWPVVKSAVAGIVSFVGGMVAKLADFWAENGAQIMSAVSNLFTGIITVINFVMPLVLAIIKSVWGNIKGVITGALDIIMGVVKIFSGLFTGDFKKMWEGLVQVFKGAVNFIWNFVQLTFYGKILGGAKAFILSFRTFFIDLWKGIIALFKGQTTSAMVTINVAWQTILRETKSIFGKVYSFFKDIFLFIKNVITGAVTGYLNIIRGGWSLIFNTTKNIFMSVFNFLKGIFNSIRTSISGSVSSILTKIRDTWSALKTNTTGAFRDIYNGIKSKFTDIVNLAKDLPRRIGDGIGSMASKVTSGVTKVINKLASTLGKGVNGVIGGINWVLDKIGVDKRIPKWEVPQYAQGTKGHPGGPMIVGDGKFNNSGPELMRRPNGDMMLSPDKPTLMNGEKGTHVWSAKETRAILANIPKYAKGTIGKAKDAVSHLWEKGKSGGKKLLDKAIDVFDYIKEPSKLLDVAIKALGIEKPTGSGFINNMAKGGWNKVKSGAVDFVKGKLADFGDEGGSAPGFGRLFGKSSSYGYRMHPILKKRIFHNGADYPAPSGTLIKAQAAGKVIQAAYHAIRGNFVKIKSGIMERIYQHNSRNLVNTGDMVRKGQGIGTVGSTGRSTGPHLHYEVKKNGKNINPQGFFKGGIVKAKQLAWVAEKGMEAIIPLVTNRAEGIDLWRQVGQHFGFDTDTIFNQGQDRVDYSGSAVSSIINKVPGANGSPVATGSGITLNVDVKPSPVYLDGQHLTDILFDHVDSRFVAQSEREDIFKGRTK